MLCENVQTWQCAKRGYKTFIETRGPNDCIIEYNDVHSNDSVSVLTLNRQKISKQTHEDPSSRTEIQITFSGFHF